MEDRRGEVERKRSRARMEDGLKKSQEMAKGKSNRRTTDWRGLRGTWGLRTCWGWDSIVGIGPS